MPQEILSSLLDDAKHLTLLPTLNVKAKRFQDIGEQNLITRHMGPEYAWREKTLSMGYFLICVHKKLYRIRFQEIKIGSLQGFEKIEFFSLFVMRKRLSSGQKWFPRPYFPLIRDMFAFRSGLRFSFQALELQGQFSTYVKMEIWPQTPLLTTGKSFSHGEKWEKVDFLKKPLIPDF